MLRVSHLPACYEYPYQKERFSHWISRLKAYHIASLILLLWACSKMKFHPIYDRVTVPLCGLLINAGTCVLLCYGILSKETLFYRLLNHPVMVYMGTLSYSLYIWQQLFLSASTYWWNLFPQNLLLTFLVAWLSYQLIEKPFLRLKARYRAGVVNSGQQNALYTAKAELP